MKQKDVALIVIVGFISVLASYFVSNLLFSSPDSRKQTAEVVDPIQDTFSEPDKKYFNTESIDPTQLIRIGDNANQAPFQ